MKAKHDFFLNLCTTQMLYSFQIFLNFILLFFFASCNNMQFFGGLIYLKILNRLYYTIHTQTQTQLKTYFLLYLYLHSGYLGLKNIYFEKVFIKQKHEKFLAIQTFFLENLLPIKMSETKFDFLNR